MIDFAGTNGVALTFLRDERKRRRGVEVNAIWRETGLFRARVKLREAMMKVTNLSILFN